MPEMYKSLLHWHFGDDCSWAATNLILKKLVSCPAGQTPALRVVNGQFYVSVSCDLCTGGQPQCFKDVCCSPLPPGEFMLVTALLNPHWFTYMFWFETCFLIMKPIWKVLMMLSLTGLFTYSFWNTPVGHDFLEDCWDLISTSAAAVTTTNNDEIIASFWDES